MPYEMDLGDGLVLRTVRDERDVARYAAFNATPVNRAGGITSTHLLHYHPASSYDDFVLVEDQRADLLVSTTCLIPWEWSLEGVRLNVAMLENVRTHPDYRRRGLARCQIDRFHEVVEERAFDLSIVEGIPFYYRQYGYAYACDIRAQDTLCARQVPDQPRPTAQGIRLRWATLADIPRLCALYDEAMEPVQVHTARNEPYWRFLLERQRYPVRVIEEGPAARIVGYVVSLLKHDGQSVFVAESSITNGRAALRTLALLTSEGAARMLIARHPTSTLTQLARSLGAASRPAYQWLVRIGNVAAFLDRIAPALERRLTRSPYAGLTADLVINLFREAFMLRFRGGRLEDVTCKGFVDASMGADGGDLCIAPDAFVRLVLGYRCLAELRDAWPDTVVRAQSRLLLEVLFPRLVSYIWTAYTYYGPLPGAEPRAGRGPRQRAVGKA